MNKLFAWTVLLALGLNGCVSTRVPSETASGETAVQVGEAPQNASPGNDIRETPGPVGTYVYFYTDAKFPVSVSDSTELIRALKELDASVAPILAQVEQARPEEKQEILKAVSDEVKALTQKHKVERQLSQDAPIWFAVPAAGPRVFTFGKDDKVTVEVNEGATTPVFLKCDQGASAVSSEQTPRAVASGREASLLRAQVGVPGPTMIRDNKPFYQAKE